MDSNYGGLKMEIFFDQIPEGYTWKDYPEGTVFVLDDTKPKRDPETFRLIWPPKRPLIYPEDIK